MHLPDSNVRMRNLVSRYSKSKDGDYPALIKTYEKAVKLAREEHVPVLIHVVEVTQPQGHSTSGSHERYKSPERLQWETDFDCIAQFKEWILEFRYQGKAITSEERLDEIREEAKKEVKAEQKKAWADYTGSINSDKEEALGHLRALATGPNAEPVNELVQELDRNKDPLRKEVMTAVRKVIQLTAGSDDHDRQHLLMWYRATLDRSEDMYSSELLSSTSRSATSITHVPARYDTEEMADGRLILRDNFKAKFEAEPLLLTFGEDTGKIGGVNQSMEGMQETFTDLRVQDTGIREATIIGQGIGMAMRGLRPLAEIQYLDYLLYALQIMSDDLATVRYRTKGQQKAPLIVRTRGHRLEGIWHSGSPMGMIINALRGMIICVPRNMTRAAGMFNTLLAADDPGLIIEPLNGYRN